MKRPTPISAPNFRIAFVLFLVIAVSALFVAVCWPLIKPLLLGAMLTGLLRPLYRWLLRVTRGRKSLASVLTLLILFVLIVGPISAFLGVVIKQALNVSEQAIPWLRDQFSTGRSFNPHAWLAQQFPAVASFLPSETQLVESLGSAAQSAGGFLVTSFSRMTASTANLLLNFFVMLYAMFFFLRDGDYILERILYYIPLHHEDEVRMLQRFTSVTRATVKGTLVIGALQGALAGIAFWAAGIDGAAFWGTIMAILSVIPGVGSALVWIPAVIYLFVTGQTLPATLLAAWCAGVVGTIDNVLRPVLVGKDAQMPDLLIMIGTLGGLFLFGAIGFIIGPIVCGLFLTVWEIYGSTFKGILPPVKNLETSASQEATLEDTTPASKEDRTLEAREEKPESNTSESTGDPKPKE